MVKCRIGHSPIHGLGLFAVDFIPAGTITWQFDASIDTIYSLEEYLTLADEQKRALRHFSYVTANKEFILCGDHAVFMNHQNAPNTVGAYNTSEYGEDIAARDILAGEELTCNYTLWDYDAYWKLADIDPA